MKIILPGMQENFNINLAFIKYYYDFPQARKYYPNEQICFYVKGNFGQVSWAGEKNNVGPLATYNNFTRMMSEYHAFSTGLMFDCSSIYVNDLNCHDTVGHAILNIANTFGDTSIIVSNDYTYNYFKKHFPHCNLIASPIFYSTEGDEEKYFYEKNIFSPSSDNKSVLIPKSRTNVYINRLCNDCPFEQQLACLNKENLNSTTFSKMSIHNTCNLLNSDIHKKVLEKNELETLRQQGYTNFILADYSNYPIIQLQEYIKNLIKEEYHMEAINYLMLMLKM
jgi:hypothetical protein